MTLSPHHTQAPAPLVPCSSVDCRDPDGGYANPGAGRRPIRHRVEVNGVMRVFCHRCAVRVRHRVSIGADPDAPLRNSVEAQEGPGPEPTDEEVERTTRPYRVMAANRRLRRLIYRPPRPPSLDELSGPAFSRDLIAAWDRRDAERILGPQDVWWEGVYKLKWEPTEAGR